MTASRAPAPGATLATGGPLHEAYRRDVGRPVEELPTPALVLDLAVALANLRTMRDGLAGMPAALRPHAKVHKCPRLAQLQIEHGAIGIAVATAWEAVAMAGAGIDDVLVANQVVGPEQLDALCAAVARGAQVTPVVDDARNVRDLSAVAQRAGVQLGVLIERDVGMGRGGVRSEADGVALAEEIARLPGVTLRGVQGYEGHCMLEPDPAQRVRLARAARACLGDLVAALREAGHEIPIVSGGGTGTWNLTGADPLMTELQAGSYAVMDLFHGDLVPGFERALHVRTTVLSRHADTVVLDAGRKSIGIDFVLPRLRRWPSLEPRYVAEEHALFDFPAGECSLDLGDVDEMVPGYSPTTVNLYDVLHVVEDGHVVDVWAIVPRGPGPGLTRG